MKKTIKARFVALDIETDDPRAAAEIVGSVLSGLFDQTTAILTPIGDANARKLAAPRQRKQAAEK